MEVGNNKSRVLEYYEMYKKEVLPLLKDFEHVRLDMLAEFRKKALFKYILPIIVLIPLAWYSYFSALSQSSVGFFIICIIIASLSPLAIIILPILYLNARRKENIKFTSMVKMKALTPLLNVFGNIKWKGHDATCVNDDGVLLKNSELERSGLFISYNTRYTDDEFKGSINDVNFRISETRMFDIHGSGKNRTCICAFSGVILAFKFNKKIRNRTIVSTKGDLTKKNQVLVALLIVLPCCLELFKDGYSHAKMVLALVVFVVVFVVAKIVESNDEPLEKVELEDPKFAKRFNVYSSNQIEARYLVTPAFMERFYNLKTAFKAKNIKCSFCDDNLIIAINTKKNLFEIGNLYTSLLNQKSINEFYNELTSIYKMVDYFKLSEKTGM